jgi:hypothetical protein
MHGLPLTYQNTCLPTFRLQVARCPVRKESAAQLADLLGFLMYFLACEIEYRGNAKRYISSYGQGIA